MLTYQPDIDRSAASTQQQDKPWLLLLLCLFWLIPGLIGHDPWKPQENESMAVIVSLLRDGNWAVPQVAGLPYFDEAPLFYWLAAGLANALGWFGIAQHDAARLAAGAWVALALWGTGLAGRELFGRRFGRLAVIALLGCLGLPLWAHHVSAAVVPFAAFAWLVYAIALSRAQPLKAGILFAAVLLLLLTGANWADAVLAGLMTLVCAFLVGERKSSCLVFVLTGLALALPFAALWGYSVSSFSSSYFQIWWQQHAWGAYGGAREFMAGFNFSYLLLLIFWFAWPAMPLALWGLWQNRQDLRPAHRVLFALILCHLVYVICAGQPDEPMALPLLVYFAILAAGTLDDLRRGAAAALNWFAVLTFGLAACLVWLIWLCLVTGQPQGLVTALHKYSIMPMHVISWGAAFALLVTILWGKMLFRRRPLGRRALINWTCGMTLLLGVLVGLMQKWVDHGKSYRVVAEGVALAVKDAPANCIDVSGVSTAPVGALVYFTHETYLAAPDAAKVCGYVITGKPSGEPGWQLAWQGGRNGETKEIFYLYRRQ